jgi:hypothetical protein
MSERHLPQATDQVRVVGRELLVDEGAASIADLDLWLSRAERDGQLSG